MLPMRLSRFLLIIFVLVLGAIFVLAPDRLDIGSAQSEEATNAVIGKGKPVIPIIVNLQALSPIRQVEPLSDQALVQVKTTGGLNLVSSFKGIDYTQIQQGVPPNPAIMVGSQQVVVSVNGGFQVFDKSGNPLTEPTLFKDFWGGNCGTGSESMTYFYPFSTYDNQVGRYVLGVVGYDTAVNDGNNGYLCVAVSQTDSATDQWYLYSFDANPDQGEDYAIQFPRFGNGQAALYLGAILFSDVTFIGNRAFALDKAAMYSGGEASLVTADIGDPYFNPIPADIKGNAPTDSGNGHYFVEAEFGVGDEVRVFVFEDPWGTPMFRLVGPVPVSSYGLPLDMPQAGTSHQIGGLDNRIIDAAYENGRLWAAHTIGCNPGGGTVNCLRWYEIDIADGETPGLIQEGTFSSASIYRGFPALGVNSCGDLLVGYTKTSSATFPGVYTVGREAKDSPGQLKNETELHAGEVFYIALDGQPYHWGYYAGMALDPDGRTFWHIGPYSRLQPTARWSTWVGAFTWEGCEPIPTPTPTSTPTMTPSSSPTATETPTLPPTTTPSPSPTGPTNTPTMTASPTATATLTATPTASSSPTSMATGTPTLTPTMTTTITPTPTTTFQNWIPVVIK
ncbi:MAG: hypothetical protein WAM60_10170 [Candidatus Promineifilaceae bacterium]